MSLSTFSNILHDFPKLEHSYETIIHKKVVNADCILCIPQGVKCYIWFTSDNHINDDVVYLLMLNENKVVQTINRVQNINFNVKLAYGTIFYGTLFTPRNADKNTNLLCIEDVLHYKGVNVSTKMYVDKLDLLKTLFTEDFSYKPVTNADNKDANILLGLPLMCKDFAEAISAAKTLPYSIDKYQFITYNRRQVYSLKHMTRDELFPKAPLETNANTNDNKNTISKGTVFKVIPDIQNDIYHLYCIGDKGQEEFYDIAYIPNYTTSVLMNKLFRNIKENSNLDALEESDDEEEFENVREDKFVHLDRTFNMTCRFNAKFKKWYPVSLADESAHVVTASILETMKNGYNKRNTHENNYRHNNNNNNNRGMYKKHNSNNRYYKK